MKFVNASVSPSCSPSPRPGPRSPCPPPTRFPLPTDCGPNATGTDPNAVVAKVDGGTGLVTVLELAGAGYDENGKTVETPATLISSLGGVTVDGVAVARWEAFTSCCPSQMLCEHGFST